MTAPSQVQRHRNIPAFERNRPARIGPYLYFDGLKFATQHGHVLDVIETCRHHFPVSSGYRHYSYQWCNLVADDARFDDARIDVERFETTPQIDDGVGSYKHRTNRRLDTGSAVARPESPYNVNFVSPFMCAMIFCVTGS